MNPDYLNSFATSPIVLTESGDTLESTEKFPTGLTANTYLGKHSCGGGLHLKSQSLTHWTISCTGCNRVLEPPKSVDGYEKFSEWCVEQTRLKRINKIRLNMLWSFVCEMQPKARPLFDEVVHREFPEIV